MKQLQLSIVLPVYNEKNTIEIVIKEWKKVLSKIKINYEIVICEDGSNDGTSDFLKKIKNKYNIKLNQSNIRRGYGPAVIEGIKIASGERILSIDSDGQCDPTDFIKFWEINNNKQILIGWRKNRADVAQRLLFSKLFHSVFQFLFPVKIHDPSAPYVLYKKREVMPHLQYLQYLKEGFWWGFVGMCHKKKIKLFEIPINHRCRLNGSTQVYKINRIPIIAWSNLIGLIKLYLAN